ncbi:MAG TPA: roadblock/LC7 domain-containing protein [Gemmatimonadaceae bacterium]
MAEPRQFAVSAEGGRELAEHLSALAAASGVRCALLVDRGGRLIESSGSADGVDLLAFASLAAADFNANEQLARLVGARGFRALVHRGDRSSVHVADVGGNAVLITLFDETAAPGMVGRLADEVVERVALTLDTMASRSASGQGTEQSLLAGAEEEIDRLFDW